jgi:hypothetical protein
MLARQVLYNLIHASSPEGYFKGYNEQPYEEIDRVRSGWERFPRSMDLGYTTLTACDFLCLSAQKHSESHLLGIF